MGSDASRRHFLFQAGTGISAAWLAAQWPALLEAATHARKAAHSAIPPKFEFFSQEQAAEVDAITARMIPSDDTPGARQAGAVYFIDHALVTFAVDSQETYKNGLLDLHDRVREMFPNVGNFSTATPDQQDEVLHSIDDHQPTARRRPFPSSAAHTSFFETVRLHTIIAFLIDPESGGNRGGVGWKVIGREQEHMFQPPFGYYDKDYAGWQPNPSKADPDKA